MKSLILMLSMLALVACKPEDNAVEQPLPASVEAELVAEVNGEVITKAGLDQMAIDMFGEYQAGAMEQAARQKLLESMVSTLALSQMSLAGLSPEQKAEIDNKTKRYRENLLISQYVRANITAEPITEAMIRAHYDANPEQYGGSKARKYQMITTSQVLPPDQRQAFLELYAGMKQKDSIQAIHEKFQQAGFDTRYQSGVTEPGLLSKKLSQMINSQPPAKISEIHYLQGLPYIFKVDASQQINARPLNQVREGIRKTLAMSQLRTAVTSLSEKARQQASVTIH